MAKDDTQNGIAAAALRDGVELTRRPSVDWLNERGHLGVPQTEAMRSVIAALDQICRALGGDPGVIATARTRSLTGDFVHLPTGTFVEVDESQHFTSFRLLTLEMYPAEVRLGFDRHHYMQLCAELSEQADKYRRTKAARGFGFGGRQRQRAYYDALRDLASPAMGRPPLIRIEAAQRDPADAYRRHRDRLLALNGQ